MADWFGSDPEKVAALNLALQDPREVERKAKQAAAGKWVKDNFPQLASLDDAEAARQYIESPRVAEAEKAAAAENAGLEHGGALHAAVRGFKDAWDPTFSTSPTPVGESGGWAPAAHLVGNIAGYGSQFAILPKAAERLVGAGIKYAPRLAPILSKAPRAIAAALDLGARAELGAASGHRGIAEIAEQTGRPIDPTADLISTAGGAALQAMPLGYGGGTGLAGRGRSALMNALVGEAGLGSMGAANEIQAGGSGLEGATKTLSNPKMQIIPALGAIAGAAVKPEPFHFSRASLTPEQLAAINAPKAGLALTPEQQAANDTARAMREQNARDLLAGKQLPPPRTPLTAPRGTDARLQQKIDRAAAEAAAEAGSGPTGVPPTPHPAAVPSAQAAPARAVTGSTSVLGGVPAPAPPPAPPRSFSLDPLDIQPSESLRNVAGTTPLDEIAQAEQKAQLERLAHILDFQKLIPGSKAYLSSGQLATDVPAHIEGGAHPVVGSVGKDYWQLGDEAGTLVNRHDMVAQHMQRITLPDGKVLYIPPGFEPIMGGQVERMPVSPAHQPHGLPPAMDIYGQGNVEGKKYFLAHNPTTGKTHQLPPDVFPEYAAKLEALEKGRQAAIKEKEMAATLAGTRDRSGEPVRYRNSNIEEMLADIQERLAAIAGRPKQ